MFFLLEMPKCSIQIRCDTAHFPFSQVSLPLTSTGRHTVHFAAHGERRPRVRPCGPESRSCRSTLRLLPPPSSFSPSFAPQAEEDLSSASLRQPRTSPLSVWESGDTQLLFMLTLQPLALSSNYKATVGVFSHPRPSRINMRTAAS